PATSAQLAGPTGLAVDSLGNLFIADGTRIRRVDANGTITTVAGSGVVCNISPSASSRSCPLGDGGPAVDAPLADFGQIAVDSVGNLYIAHTISNRVRKASTNGIITTVAGNGLGPFLGDGGLATNAQVPAPTSVAVDRSGNLFIASSNRILKVSPDGTIAT